jgi:hypothetical protein
MLSVYFILDYNSGGWDSNIFIFDFEREGIISVQFWILAVSSVGSIRSGNSQYNKHHISSKLLILESLLKKKIR